VVCCVGTVDWEGVLRGEGHVVNVCEGCREVCGNFA
jgi:hypothetical protein